jgi:hypothetical protein
LYLNKKEKHQNKKKSILDLSTQFTLNIAASGDPSSKMGK